MIAEIANGLLAYKDARKPRIERALRDHLLQFAVIRNEIGTHIYASRIPRGQKPPIAVKLRVLARSRNHDIRGESEIVHTTIQVDVLSRLANAEGKVSEVSELIRLATSATCYHGYMGKPNDRIWVYGCTVERDAMETPSPASDASSGWQFQYSQDLRISHQQQQINITVLGLSPFRQGAFELDSYAIN